MSKGSSRRPAVRSWDENYERTFGAPPKDPVVFVREVLGAELEPWQEEILRKAQGMQSIINKVREQHKRSCSVWDKEYCGGPCACGLVDPSDHTPLKI